MEWLVPPLLEPFKRRKSDGSRPLVFRTIQCGIFYLFKTGCQWDFLPAGYGTTSAPHNILSALGRRRPIHRHVAPGSGRLGGAAELAGDFPAMEGRLEQAPVPCGAVVAGAYGHVSRLVMSSIADRVGIASTQSCLCNRTQTAYYGRRITPVMCRTFSKRQTLAPVPQGQINSSLRKNGE